MDHTVSDLGSIPAPSQAVVLASSTPRPHASWTRIVTAISLAALLAPAIYLRSFFQPAELPIDPTDYAARTKRALSQTPIIDGHNDLPYLIRVELQNKVYDGFDLKHKLLGHTDIQRMRTGQVGGQFWSCYVQCPGVNDPELYKQENLDQPTVSHDSCRNWKKYVEILTFVVDCPRHTGANRCHKTTHS
jgi:membrane dipeptidase